MKESYLPKDFKKPLWGHATTIKGQKMTDFIEYYPLRRFTASKP